MLFRRDRGAQPELSLELQVKLLRFLEERSVRKVGSRSYERIDVRVIASTNRDIDEMVRRGEFREDLYYRLRKAVIAIPPLRERKEDIPVLVRHFMKELNCPKLIAPDVMAAFMEYDWPGNVRELKNCLESAVILSEGETITLESIPENISGDFHLTGRRSENRKVSLKFFLNEYERLLIESALRKAEESKSKAAKLLGISRQSLLYKVKKLSPERTAP